MSEEYRLVTTYSNGCVVPLSCSDKEAAMNTFFHTVGMAVANRMEDPYAEFLMVVRCEVSLGEETLTKWEKPGWAEASTEVMRPCPFCGSINIYTQSDEDGDIYAACGNCGAQSAGEDTGEGAIRIWNARVEDHREQEEKITELQRNVDGLVGPLRQVLSAYRRDYSAITSIKRGTFGTVDVPEIESHMTSYDEFMDMVRSAMRAINSRGKDRI